MQRCARTALIVAVLAVATLAGCGPAKTNGPIIGHDLPTDTNQLTQISRVTGLASSAEITIEYVSNPCYSLVRIDIDESTPVIGLALKDVSNGSDCDDVGYVTKATVTLSAPVGDRTFLDYSTGTALELS